MSRKLYILTVLIVLASTGIKAQNYPVYSQYLLDGLTINPAYTGVREVLSTNISARRSMLNIEGSPLMGTFSLHSPLKRERIALGVMAHYQTYGKTQKASAFAHYAYHIKTEAGTISLGLKAGVDMFNNNYSGISTVDPDPAFTNAVESFTLPNVGAGAYFYNKKLFAGISVPEMFSYRPKGSGSGYEFYHDYENYYFMGLFGGLISLSDGFKIKPSVLARYSINNPLILDLNTNIILADMVWLGASWRMGEDVVVGMLEFQVSQQFRIGYAYEYKYGEISSFTNGTHEIALRFGFGKKVNAANPRYF